MYVTRTGEFPIGFRERFKDSIAWAREASISVIELADDVAAQAAEARKSGLTVAAITLENMKGMLSADPSTRKSAQEANRRLIEECSDDSPTCCFTVSAPENPDLPPRRNFEFMVESYAQLQGSLQETGSRLVIEGWPGPGAVCCTPEAFRAFFKECSADCYGINYDPSHLVRMGIEPIRFLEEFVDRIYHVHGKDTEILTSDLYEYGHELPPVFRDTRRFAGGWWRYTIPGFGLTPWPEVFRILSLNGYAGAVAIELEDDNFWETPALQREGILTGAQFLSRC